MALHGFGTYFSCEQKGSMGHNREYKVSVQVCASAQLKNTKFPNHILMGTVHRPVEKLSAPHFTRNYSDLRDARKSLGIPHFLKLGMLNPLNFEVIENYFTTNTSEELQLMPIEMQCLFTSTIINWSRSATN